MSSAISSVRHSFNESLKILSLVCCFTLMMCSGHYCLSLYLVPGHCWPPAKNWSPTLSSSHHPGEPSVPLQHHGLQTPSNTASFLWKTLGHLCDRDPQPFKFPQLGSFGTTRLPAELRLSSPSPWQPHGWSARSGQHERVPAFLSSHGSSPEAFPRPDAWICAPGPCCCTQGGGSPGPAAECGGDNRARQPRAAAQERSSQPAVFQAALWLSAIT